MFPSRNAAHPKELSFPPVPAGGRGSRSDLLRIHNQVRCVRGGLD